MTGNDNNPIARGEHVTDMLSAYIDGTLEAAERDSVRAHLDGCGACRADHAELLSTRAMLRAVPAVQAPRSFTLTPEMARKVRPPSLFERIFVPSNAPRMAMGSVLSFVLLFFVLVGPQFFSSFAPGPAAFSKIGYGLSGDGPAPSEMQQDQDTARTTSGQAEPTATTGSAAEVALAPPMGTPVPEAGGTSSNTGGYGGEVQPAVPTVGTSASGPPLPAAVPTMGAGAAGSDTGTTAAEAPTALAEAPPDMLFLTPPNESARQPAPAVSPPVDVGATLASIVPLFLVALGLALAVMAWIASRSRPV